MVFDPDYAVPPGQTLEELLIALHKDPCELLRFGYSSKMVVRLIQGKMPITEHIASQLQSITGVDAQFWINLEKNYRKRSALLKRKPPAKGGKKK